jgi:hypothetical protein
MEAQAAGRIHPLKVCVTAATAVNPGRPLRVEALLEDRSIAHGGQIVHRHHRKRAHADDERALIDEKGLIALSVMGMLLSRGKVC